MVFETYRQCTRDECRFSELGIGIRIDFRLLGIAANGTDRSESLFSTTTTTTLLFERMDPTQLVGIQNRSFPSLEYVLQGSIQDDSVHLLIARLQGLCDNITGQFLSILSSPITIVYFLQVKLSNSTIMKSSTLCESPAHQTCLCACAMHWMICPIQSIICATWQQQSQTRVKASVCDIFTTAV